MRAKLILNLEDLTVDSFDTTIQQKQKGTVFGEQCTCWTQCRQNTCPGCPTCDASCNGTCDASCNGSCAADTCYNSCGGGCEYSMNCDTNQPCPTAQYTHCGAIICY